MKVIKRLKVYWLLLATTLCTAFMIENLTINSWVIAVLASFAGFGLYAVFTYNSHFNVKGDFNQQGKWMMNASNTFQVPSNLKEALENYFPNTTEFELTGSDDDEELGFIPIYIGILC